MSKVVMVGYDRSVLQKQDSESRLRILKYADRLEEQVSARLVYLCLSGGLGSLNQRIQSRLELLSFRGVAPVRLLRAIRRIRQDHADLVVFQTAGVDALVLTTLGRQKRFIVQLHAEYGSLSRSDRFAMWWLLPRAVGLRVVHPDLPRWVTARSRKMWIAPVGVDDQFLLEGQFEVGTNTKSIVIAARLDKERNIEQALRILSRQEFSDLTLNIAGSGPEEKSLKKYSVQLGVADRTRFLGQLDPKELCQLYDQAAVCLVTAPFESYGRTALEAMARGAVVCSTPTLGARHFESRGCSIVLSPSFGDDDVASALERAIEKSGEETARAEARRLAVDLCRQDRELQIDQIMIEVLGDLT